MESYRILFKSPSLADCPYIIIYLLLDLSSIFFSSSLCVYIYLSSRFYQNINSHIILFIYTWNWCSWLPLQFSSFFISSSNPIYSLFAFQACSWRRALLESVLLCSYKYCSEFASYLSRRYFYLALTASRKRYGYYYLLISSANW